ncbi:MAG: hypothetical protein AB1657_04305 [Candidatus Micrarchaeota archaeon]
MFESVGEALEHFSRDPVAFMVPTILYPVFMLITLGAAIGVLFILFLVLTLAGAGGTIMTYVLGAVGAFLALAYLILAAGYKGAMVSEYNNATEKREVGLVHYMNYAFSNAGGLFVISLVKLAITGFVVMPFVLLYYFLLVDLWEGWTYIFGLAALFLVFAIEFLFSFSFTAYAVRKVSPITAMMISFNFIKEKNVKAFLIYGFYAAVALSVWIPILNIITYLVFYPIAYASLILFFKRGSSG